MRWIVLLVVAAFIALISGALAYAPYLPRLVAEGIPPLVWEAMGAYAVIPAAPVAQYLERPDKPPKNQLSAELTDLMTAYEGKALLAARNGVLEIEYYAPGFDADTRLNSYSMAKSLVAALVFKAVAEQRLSGLDVTLGAVLPEAKGLSDIMLSELLTMRAGIILESANEGFGAISGDKTTDPSPNPFGELARLHFLGIEAIEDDLAVDSGMRGQFAYQNVNTALLAQVLERIYGRSVDDLLAEKLWLPAGAGRAYWRKPTEQTRISAYCCLYATPRDFIRVGIYLAANGIEKNQFLPDDLWRQFLGLDVPASARRIGNYDMHVRQDILDREGRSLHGNFSYFIGQNGQKLYLMPQQSLVVYRAGNREQLLHSTLYAVWDMIAQR